MAGIFNVVPLLGLLLLAPQADSLGIRGQQAPATVGSASQMATATATNEATEAMDAAQTYAGEVGETGELVETEQKKALSHLNNQVKSLLPPALADGDGNTDYMISSFPEMRVINYVRFPSLVWRPLVVKGLMSPRSIVVDADRFRLYVADTGLAKIVWYQLIALPNGLLISDGRQHVAVEFVKARGLSVDMKGDLWFSGESVPLPPAMSQDAIWMQTLMNIDQATVRGTPPPPEQKWRKGATKTLPGPIVLDAFNIYYGTDSGGKTKGSVVKASQEVPLADPSSAMETMADNIDATSSIAVTPTGIFYASDGEIFGIQASKVGGSCGATGALCTVVSDMVKKPTCMRWNGDGTVFVADNEAGAVYSFASGSVARHALDKVIDAKEVWGIEILKVGPGQRPDESSSTAMAPTMLLLIASVLAVFH